MEIQQFRYFLAAARYENLTKAAEDLHIAQPALSQSIKRLETELGISLFVFCNAKSSVVAVKLDVVFKCEEREPDYRVEPV